MRRFSAVRAIALSFFSPEVYRDVVREWRGAGLAYLLLVTVLAALPFLIRLHVVSSRFTQQHASAILRQIPAISIRHGRVSSTVRMPYVIRGSGGEALAIIDTTGQPATLDSTGALLLLTSDHVITRRRNIETRMYDLSRIERFDLDEARVTRWVHLFTTWFTPVFAPFVFVGSYLAHLFKALIFAGIAAILAALLQLRLPFAALMRLAAVAMTPMLAIDAIRGAFFWQVPWWWLWSSLIVIAYLLVALKANQLSQAPAAPEPEVHPLG